VLGFNLLGKKSGNIFVGVFNNANVQYFIEILIKICKKYNKE